MNNKLTRQEMIVMLHELDASIETKLEFEICGASSAILNHGLDRASTDIDVLRPSSPLSDQGICEAIKKIAIKHGVTIQWINDDAKVLFSNIPEHFEFDTDPINGEIFQNIKPRVISKADFVITKLAHHDTLRLWDITDVKKILLTEGDLKRINTKLDNISQKRPYDAIRIEAHFKATRPDMVKTNAGYSYTNAAEVADYSLKRYGVGIDEKNIKHWQIELDKMESKASNLVAKIDFSAAEKIKNKDEAVLKADQKFRIVRQKEIENGFDF